ncbi:MAG: lipopolysaccharide transport periplasmic protein LptA [Cellvibrio sp.]
MNPNFNKIIMRFTRAAALLLVFGSVVTQALPTDKNQALRIVADKQEIDLKQGVVVYSGDAKFVQGSLEITASKITVRRAKDQSVESIFAEGSPAKYKQQLEAGKPVIHAEANKLNYNVKDEYLVMDDNVSIEQDGAVTKSGHADYDIKSQTAKFSIGRVETVIPAKTTEKKD